MPLQIPLNLLSRPQQLKIRSLNPTSCAKEIKLANGTTKSRLWLIKNHLITTADSHDPIDIMCLQETAIPRRNNHLHDHPTFNRQFEQFSIYQDESTNVARRKRGQMVLINKQLRPHKLSNYTDETHGTFLPIQFTQQSTSFIIVAIYITTHIMTSRNFISKLSKHCSII